MTYTTAIELSDLMKCECPTPSSFKFINNSNIKNAWNNNGNRMKHQSLLSALGLQKVHVHQERPLQVCFVDMVIAS